ncbi:MAG: hypothetical protein HC906_10085 [Bacteroidales bacterium]|nr:hypothetical protein [Bacteroidales bacterium]
MVTKRIKFAFFIFILLSYCSFAQEINRNVVVVKPYEPSLSDAYKLSTLPRIEDTATISPEFNYSILPVRVDAPFDLKPINAAKMVGVPLEKYYKSYLKLGLGNYYSTLAEYNINTLREKDHSLGFYFSHRASNTKLKLDNADKVPAGYSSNRLEGYANKYFPNTTLSGNAFFDYGVNHYYGYNTELFPDSFPLIKEKEIRQYFSTLGGDFRVYSTNVDSTQPAYYLNFKPGYLWDRFKNTESTIILEGGLKKLINQKEFGIDMVMDYAHSRLSSDSLTNSIVGGSPYFSKKNEEFEFLVGGRLFYGGEDEKFYVFPRAYLQINVVKNILMPYMGIDGSVTPGTYGRLVKKNPFIAPGSLMMNSDNLFVYGGIKGILSSKAGYNIGFSFDAVNDEPLFVNDTVGELDNMFGVIHDDLAITKFRLKPGMIFQ